MGRRCCALKASAARSGAKDDEVEPVVHAFGRLGGAGLARAVLLIDTAVRIGAAFAKVAPAKIAGAWDWSHGGWGAMGMGPHPDIIMPDAA